MAEPAALAPLGLEEVRRALAEDHAREDATTRLLGAAATQPATARFIAEGRSVVAGLEIATLVFRELDPRATAEPLVADGEWAQPGATLLRVRASAGVLLSGERVALNFLQRLSGIATETRRAVEAVAGTPAKITHTRKTTPGLRALELLAVRAGGGVENRASLADAVMWKDNHWVLLDSRGPSLSDVLRRRPAGMPVVVEVETAAQLEAALAAGVRHLLVDNQGPERLAEWARRAGPEVTIQASGGITAGTARAYAAAGAHLIAIGALTQSAPAAAISMELIASR